MQPLGQVLFDSFDSLSSSAWTTSAVVFAATIVFLWLRNWLTYQPPVVLSYQPVMCGDITLETLSMHDGRDFLKPLYFAVRGKVYDVTKGKDFYGPGKCFHHCAGFPVKPALSMDHFLGLHRCWVPHFCWQGGQPGISKNVAS